jgi:hypothetical protein
VSDVALRFGATDDGLTAKFRQVNAQLEAFQGKVASVETGLRDFGKVIASVFVVDKVLDFSKALLDNAEAVENLAQRTGIATDVLEKMQLGAALAGLDIEATAAAIGKMQKALIDAEEGTAKQVAAFKSLGLSISEIRALTPDQQFETISQALANMSDKARQVSVGTDLLGKSFASQLPIILQAATGYEQAGLALDKIGGPLGKQTLDTLDAMGDSLDTTAVAAKNLGSEILALAGPAITEVANKLTEFFGGLRILMGGGGNEVVDLSKRIEDLNAQAKDFENSFFEKGREHWRELVAEADKLKGRLDAILGVGTALTPRFLQPAIDTLAAGLAPGFGTITDPTAKRIPTSAEQRAATDKGPDQITLAVDENAVLEQINQEHLDVLLEQLKAHSEEKIQVQTAAESLLSDVRRAYGIEEIDFEEFKNETLKDLKYDLAASAISIATALFGQNKKVAIAVGLINVAVGATEALRLPFPANLAAVAKVLAQGASLIARIKQANIGSTSVGGGAGGGGESAAGSIATREQAQATQRITEVTVRGTLTDGSGRVFADLISDEIQNRDVVIISSTSRQGRELVPAGG